MSGLGYALTSAQQAAIRARNWRPGKYLSIIPRTNMGEAVITEVHYDSETGSVYELITDPALPADLRAKGWTADIGTSAGASDVGRVRVRHIPADTTLGIALTPPGEVLFAVGQHITLRDEFRPWQVDYRVQAAYNIDGSIASVVEYLDYNRVFGAPHTSVIPKANITAGTVTNPDGTTAPLLICPAGWEDVPGCGYRTIHFSTAWAQALSPGKSISTVEWEFIDGTPIDSGDAEVDVQFPVGFRHVFLTVVDEDGETNWMVFPIWAHDDTYLPLTIFDITSDETQDGREMELEFFGNPGLVDQTVIPQGATICYWEAPKFETSVPAYRDHCLGWITEDTPLLRKVDARYTVRLAGAAWWLDHFFGGSQALRDPSPAVPAAWSEMVNIDLKRSIWWFLANNSTFGNIVNYFCTSEVTQTEQAVNVDSGTIWEQFQGLGEQFGMCNVGCDHFGSVVVERKFPYRNQGQRIGIIPALDLFATDITEDGIALTTRQSPNYAQVEGEGDYFDSGINKKVLFASVAPHTPSAGTNRGKLPGQRLPTDRPQGTLNELTALHHAWLNSDQASVNIPLLQNLDVINPCSQRPIRITWVENTVHGVKLQQALFMVMRVTTTHSNGAPDGTAMPPAKLITWEVSKVTWETAGRTIPVPVQDEGVTVPPDVVCDPPVADASIDVSVCLANFDGTASTGDIVLYFWDFGDESYGIGATASHSYAAPGTYPVALYVVDSCGQFAVYSGEVEISSETAAADVSVAVHDHTVSFTDESSAESGILSWAWVFGDGETSTEQNPVHEYADIDAYDWSLTITSMCGTTATTTGTVDLSALVADFVWDAGDSLDVWFYDRSNAPGTTITSWDWDFDDTGTSTSQNPHHTYGSSGSYDVTLTIHTADARTAMVTKTITADVESLWEHISDFTDADTLEDGWEVMQGVFSAGVGFIASGSDEPQIFRNFPFPAKVSYWESYYFHDHVAGSATQLTHDTVQTSIAPIVDGVYNSSSDYHETHTNGRNHTANNSNAFGTIFDSTAVQGLWEYNRTSRLGSNTITKALLRGSGHDPFLS